jgi:O-methyltransferase involved in polyketide biosynthesis
MKEQIKLNTVEETLLIPLYMRAKESVRKNSILKDEISCKLVSNIDYDFSIFDKAAMSSLGCVIRSRHFDKKVQEFIFREKDPVVINAGCGLDTRYHRLKCKDNVVFYDLDLPDVIKLREKLLPPAGPANIYITASLTETDWMDMLKEKHAGCSFIFILEGVIMYFYENQVKSILGNLASRFPGGEIHLDVCGTMFTKNNVKHDTLKHTKAVFLCGINDGREIEKWVPRLELTDSISYMNVEKKRWGLKGFLIRLIPGFARKFSSILGYRIKI